MSDDVRNHKIEKRGDEWCVTSEDGSKTLGCHPTRQEAVDQLGAIEASKAGRKDNAMRQRTSTDDFHYHPYDPEAEYTEPPVGDPNGHQHAIERDDDRAVTGFAEAAGHTHTMTEGTSHFFAEDKGKKGKKEKADLYDLSDVEIFRTGTWNGDKYTAKDLDDMVSAFDTAGFRPPVKLGHREESGDPAYGWVSKLRRAGERLVADFTDLPKSIYNAIKDRRFDSVSSEIFWNFKREGKTLRRVLKGVALLGAEIPAVAGLKPLRESFKGLSWEKAGSYTIEKDDIMADDPNKAKDDKSEAQVAELTAKVAELTEQLTAATKQAEEARAKADTQADDDDSALTIKSLTEKVAELQKANEAAVEARRRETISNKVKDIRIPALRDHLYALYDLATLNAERTVKFKLGEGDDMVEKDVSPIKVIDDLVARLNRHTEKLLLNEHSYVSKDVLTRDDAPTSDDPEGELHRLTKAYMADKGEKDYAAAFNAVLQDPENSELKKAYARVDA